MHFLRFVQIFTPQRLQADARQVPAHDAGWAFTVDRWTQLDRFVTLGTESGTFYVTRDALTEESAANVRECLAEDGPRVVARVIELSEAGRAVKQDYGLFVLALALASEDVPTRAAAYAAIGKVARTAATLFALLAYVRGRRSWSGKGFQRAIARWYDQRPLDDLAYQMVKYRERSGFTHRDVLRLAHPRAANGSQPEARQTMYRWAVGKTVEGSLPAIVTDYETAKADDSRRDLARRLPREALPTAWLNDPNVWEALLYGEDRRGMPLGALVRNLGNLSKCGLLTAGSEAARYVIEQLGDPRRIAASRLHPMAFFVAGRTYAAGRGVRGSGMWAPVGAVVDALERAFEAALGNVQPAGRRVLVAVDASGSMSSPVLGYPNVSARDASLALAHVIARTEPSARLIGFTDGTNTAEFAVAADERLRDFAQRFNERVEPRGTDCAEPFAWAGRQSASFDAVVTLTDSETWAGSSHPHEAFRAYRERFGRGCRAIVAATTATRLTVLPDEPNVLQVAGFDAALPQLLASFLREGPGPAAAA